MRDQSTTEIEKIKINLELKLKKLEIQKKRIIQEKLIRETQIKKAKKNKVFKKIIYVLSSVVIALIILLSLSFHNKSHYIKNEKERKIISKIKNRIYLDSLNLIVPKNSLQDSKNQNNTNLKVTKQQIN